MFDFGYTPLPHDDSQYFVGVETGDINIPVADAAAYKMYPQYQWMYNKILLCEAQNITTYPDGVSLASKKFPLFRKPIINLYGMSAGAEKLETLDQYNKSYKPGYFIMPFITGLHFTIDVAVCEGLIKWMQAMTCRKDHNGSFTLFEFTEVPYDIQSIVHKWIYTHLSDHTGVINFEIIGETIIECHLRMSSQYIDLYGHGWLENVVNLYKNHKWKTFVSPKTGFSKPIRVSKPGIYSFSEEALEQAKEHCSSIQLYIVPGQNIQKNVDNDMNTYRLAVINSHDHCGCERAYEILMSGLTVNK